MASLPKGGKTARHWRGRNQAALEGRKMSHEGDTPAPKVRRRQAGKTARPQDGEKVKVTLYVPVDLAKRFTVHAAMTGMDKSALFAELVRNGCKRFVISDRGQGDPVEAEGA